MTIQYIVAHRKDPNNVGDVASNPLQYFLNSDQYQTVDAADLYKESYPTGVPIILGGGGLFGNQFIGDAAQMLCNSPDRLQLERMHEDAWTLSDSRYQEMWNNFNQQYHRLISNCLANIENNPAPKHVWGAGHNGDPVADAADLRYSKALANFDKVGLRDDIGYNRYDWVPCASCMHPALRKTYSIRNDVIWFEHKKQLTKDFGPDSIPRFVNSGSNVEQTIELLGSANIILTNSYHGVYWGTLLGKRVVLTSVWSSKFQFFRHAPAVLEKRESWRDAVQRATVHENALDECVQANENFWASLQ